MTDHSGATHQMVVQTIDYVSHKTALEEQTPGTRGGSHMFSSSKNVKKKNNKNQYDNASGLKKKGSSELTRLPTALDKRRQ
jgi:hypothetical protein